ncbi:cyclase family protein [Flaviaesturariibacter amylovorans]|uniref:Cyclase family protein n=1 Tax=Flaviaesturariibacter amylovorans TaxID=1084520 RepID=A0ABP8HSF8_9BACT
MNRIPFFSCLLLLAACAQPDKRSAPFSGGRWIDLTHSFSEKTLYWPNNPTGFRLDTQAAGMTPGGYYYASNAICAPEHGGTHLDAPIHFAEGKQTADQVPLDHLTGNAVVVDVSAKALANRDYLVSIADLEAFEKAHGSIAEGSIVLLHTGYDKFYPDAARYFGTAEKGAAAIPKLHFPGIDPEAARWLAARRVKAVGLDTPSLDYGQSTDFRSHRVLLGENIPGFENVAHLDSLPPTGAYVVALPVKIQGGSGGPLRIVAWVGN